MIQSSTGYKWEPLVLLHLFFQRAYQPAKALSFFLVAGIHNKSIPSIRWKEVIVYNINNYLFRLKKKLIGCQIAVKLPGMHCEPERISLQLCNGVEAIHNMCAHRVLYHIIVIEFRACFEEAPGKHLDSP